LNTGSSVHVNIQKSRLPQCIISGNGPCDLSVLDGNEAFFTLSGLTAPNTSGGIKLFCLEAFALLDEDAQAEVWSAIESVGSTLQELTPEYETSPVLYRITCIKLEGATNRYLLTLSNESRTQRLESELLRSREILRRDELTGLLNRKAFVSSIRALQGNHDSYLAFIDINGFAIINNRIGHFGADNVLRLVGAAMLRVEQAFTNGQSMAFAGRYAGDEFCFIVHGPVEECRNCLNSLFEALSFEVPVARLATPEVLGRRESAVQISCSIGCVCVREAIEKMDTIAHKIGLQMIGGIDTALSAADTQMYEAKKAVYAAVTKTQIPKSHMRGWMDRDA
jgi:diguanylate cyclase (GGDEF)-like protein